MSQFNNEKAYAVFSSFKNKFYKGKRGNSESSTVNQMKSLLRMDEELQILFQRINKKSAKARETRLKSLRRLSELLKTKDARFLDGFVKIFAIIFEKLILSENDAEILSLNQKCLKTILQTSPKSIMKSYGMFLPQLLLACEEVHEEASRLAKANLSLLVTDKSKIGKAVMLFCDKFIILLGPLLNNSLSYLKEIGCDKDPKVLAVISEKLCQMSLKTLAHILEYVSMLGEDKINEGFESFRMMLFEESVKIEEDQPEEGDEELVKPKKKKKKKRKKKKNKKEVKCFDVLKKYPKSKSVRGALVQVLEELFLTKLDERLPQDIRETLIKKLFSSFLCDENVLIQRNFYTRDFLNRIIQVANSMSLKIDSKSVLDSVVVAIHKFSHMIGAPFYNNLLNVVKSLKCTQTLNEEFLFSIGELLEAFQTGFLESHLGHEVDNHFQCCFDIAEWALFEKLNLENEGELIFCDKIMQVFGEQWVKLYLERNNPNQKSFLVRGINEIKYVPLKLVAFLRSMKHKYSTGKVNRYRIIEKMFLSRVYDIVKESISPTLNSVHLTNNLKAFVFQFTKNILSSKDLLLDEIFPFKKARLQKAQTQVISESTRTDNSFLSKATKKDFSKKDELYSQENLENPESPERGDIEDVGLNNDFEMSNWSKTGSDVVSLGRSVSIVMRRMSDFSNRLLLSGPVDSQGKIYKDPNVGLLEVSFDIVSLLIHSMIQPLDEALNNAKKGIDFEESCVVLKHVSEICLKTLNPLGLIYYRSSAIRGKMETVIDNFVTSIERVFNQQVLKHRVEKSLPSRTKLRTYYIIISELFKSLSGFVSLENLSSTFKKMFAHFKTEAPSLKNQVSLLASKSEYTHETKAKGSSRPPSIKSFQRLNSFTGKGLVRAKTTNLDDVGTNQTFFALKVQAGKISSITRLQSATNLTNMSLIKGESVAHNVIMEESEEGFSGKKSEQKGETNVNHNEIIVSQFGQGSLELMSQTELESEKKDEVGDLEEKKQKYSNAFKLFHARMFNSMLKEEEENDEIPSCTAALSRRRQENPQEEKSERGNDGENKKSSILVRENWKPSVMRIEEFFNMLTQVFFGIKGFYASGDTLAELDSYHKMSPSQKADVLGTLLDKQEVEFKKREFIRNKDTVVAAIQSMKDYVNHSDSMYEVDDCLSSPSTTLKHASTFRRKKSKFSDSKVLKPQKLDLDFNEELFGTILLTRRFQRIKNLELVGSVMELGITFDKPGMFLLSRYFLKFDEKDLFLHRIFLDNIQSHFREITYQVCSSDLSTHLFSLIETSQETDHHEQVGLSANQSPYITSKALYDKDNSMNQPEQLLKKNLYLSKMKEEKGISFPLKYLVHENRPGGPRKLHFFNSLILEKARLLGQSINKFEQKFLIENKSLFISSEVKRINKINMWREFWEDFAEYIHSFGRSSMTFKKKRLQARQGKGMQNPKSEEEKIIFDLNNFLSELVLNSKLRIETLQGILHIVIEILLSNRLVSRETLVLVNKLSSSITLKNNPSTGNFILKELEALLTTHPVFNLKDSSHLELFNALLTGFPRADIGVLMFTLLQNVIEESEDSINHHGIDILVNVINNTSSLYQFVSGHQSQTGFWSEMMKNHLRNAFLNVLWNGKDQFVMVFVKLLWFGRKSFTVRQFLLDLVFEMQRAPAVSSDHLKEILCRVFKFIFVKLNSSFESDSRETAFIDFYTRLVSTLPLSLLEFDLFQFVDLLKENTSPNPFKLPYEDATKSLTYISILEIGAILSNDPLFLGLNAIQLHITKSKITDRYRKEISIQSNEELATEEADVPVSAIKNHVITSICELAEINDITLKGLRKEILLNKLTLVYDLSATLDHLESLSPPDESFRCMINGSLLRAYSFLLRKNKVDIFSEKVEIIENKVKESLSISSDRTNSYWRYSCISLLRFIRRVILYIEMFSEDVQNTLLNDVMKLAIDFTKQFNSKSLEAILKSRFAQVNQSDTLGLSSNESSQFSLLSEENLSETFEEFQVEVAETISRFSLRHSLDIPSEDVISLLGSSIPQFRKAAFFLLARSENSILKKKFDLNTKDPEYGGENLDEKQIEQRNRETERDLLNHLNPSFHQFFLPTNETTKSLKTHMSLADVSLIEDPASDFEIDTTLDLLFVSDDINSINITSSSNKVLEASVVKFEKKMLPQLLFWSVLLRLASNEWETVIGDHISHFLGELFECNPEQYFHILERVFMYARFRQSQIHDILSMSSGSSDNLGRKQSTLSMLSNTISDEAIYISPDVLLEASENLNDSELCTTFTLNIIFMFATSFPKTLRKFVSSPQKKKLSKFAEHLISLGISQSVFKKEVNRIILKKPIWESEEFMVSYYMRSQEIIACLIKDETTIQINITVPSNYPLKQASVRLGKGLRLPEKKSIKWLLMMKKLLVNHNVAITEALGIWKHNLEKQFDGIEPCPICYYVVHFNTKDMPRKACRTCNNKFHSSCISKWFQTSSKAECPMCKSQFI